MMPESLTLKQSKKRAQGHIIDLVARVVRASTETNQIFESRPSLNEWSEG